MNNRKWFLIAGGVTLLISLGIIFPIEYGKSSTIDDFGYTYTTLAVGVLVTMYGVMGKHIIKGLLFLVLSTVISFCSWYIIYHNQFWGMLPILYEGIPSGIIAGLIFLIVDYKLLTDENRYKLFLKRLISYSLILIIVSVLFANGGDWVFELSEYFKSKAEQ